MSPLRWWDREDAGRDVDDEVLEREHKALLQEIAAEARLTSTWTGEREFHPRVMAALAHVRREEFVPEHLRAHAYLNQPLPIGEGQTISQPYIVALMTHLLRPEPDHVVLEVGTGCGYQAAVLSRVVDRVYTVEIVPALARSAAERLARLGYDNVEVRQGDGHQGWPEHAPYDGIMVTAASRSRVPPALVEQLAPGARLVIPVGGAWGQKLELVHKRTDGTVDTQEVLPVAFVPMTGSG